jgi:S-(hydroxymethyl)glutathione dehydrogenase / alcohol dehydrogenase
VNATGESRAARAVVLRRHGKLPTIETVEVRAPGAEEVRIKMLAAGVCHTDIAAIRDARSVPLVLGHEGVGLIESVGVGGDEQLLGTRVLLIWKTPCGSCRRCLQQRSHLCERTRSLPHTVHDSAGEPLAVLLDTGCFCDYVVIPAEAVVQVPSFLADTEAALVGCAVATGVGAALYSARVEPGDFVGVWGVGGVGQNIVAGARLAHAGVIVAVDPNEDRRRLALARGATVACPPEDAVMTIDQATGARGLDVAFEAVGEPAVMSAAIDALGVGGQLVLVGAASRDAVLPLAPRPFMSRQLRLVGCIYGSLRPRIDLPMLLRLCVEGELSQSDLIGEVRRLEDVPNVFETKASGVRTVVTFA